jgi:hypothetical protein
MDSSSTVTLAAFSILALFAGQLLMMATPADAGLRQELFQKAFFDPFTCARNSDNLECVFCSRFCPGGCSKETNVCPGVCIEDCVRSVAMVRIRTL